jgi:2-polyprenyl-3-methyl-5-hydroxy-6-metoxy-1,4-benzoquinol methylase
MMILINRKSCAICDGDLTHFYKLLNVPIKLSCTINNNNYNYEEMSYSECLKCNTIQLDKLIPLNILYSESHNYTSVGKVWDGYFKLFCNLIYSHTAKKNILEIGDPSGKIANALDNYNKWYIVEPNKNKNIQFDKNIEFITGFFDENFYIYEKIDLIVHSHLFEHIYEPNKFLKKCWDLLQDNGEMFFGIPNMEHIADNKISLF